AQARVDEARDLVAIGGEHGGRCVLQAPRVERRSDLALSFVDGLGHAPRPLPRVKLLASGTRHDGSTDGPRLQGIAKAAMPEVDASVRGAVSRLPLESVM